MNPSNQRQVWTIAVMLCSLALLFSTYDLIVLLFGKAPTLFNVRVNDGMRIDESYMYLAGTAKTILFDPYLKEHAQDLTLRPMLPTLLFHMLYVVCGKNINAAIFLAHVVPPLFSCVFLYLVARKLAANIGYAVFATLLAMGHFIYTPLTIIGTALGQKSAIAGPDLYLFQRLIWLGDSFADITAPTQFTRLFSPSLTLPFLLAPLYLLISQSRPGLRGALTAINLYSYPHHILILGVMEVVFWIKERRVPGGAFFLMGLIMALPFLAQNIIVYFDGNSDEIYARVGRTHDNSPMWFFTQFFVVTTILQFHVTPRNKGLGQDFFFSLGCSLSALVIWACDTFLFFPQVHLVGLRIFAFLAPLSFICLLKHVWPTIPRTANVIVFMVLFAGQAKAGWIHRHIYADFPKDGIVTELNQLAPGTVVMTDVQYEIPYISAATDKYSYLAYGIVSAAGNAELLQRFAVVARIYDWEVAQLYGGNWDDLLSTYHWVYHHGAPSTEICKAAFEKALASLDGKTKCELLSHYQVNFIRYKSVRLKELESCTQSATEHFLEVLPKR